MQKGYKVARIEQMETPDMMAERCRKSEFTLRRVKSFLSEL